MPLRFAAAVIAAALCATAATAVAATRTAGSGPGLVHRGQLAAISVATGAAAPCSLIVSYANGRMQDGAVKRPHAHRVAWTLRVPVSAPLGVATWQVRCGLGFTSHGSFVVVGALSTTGSSVDLPKVVVDKQGYSQRNDTYGTGSSVSWGLMLRNTSVKEDAENVYVLVNFVAANGSLLGSMTDTVGLVPAGGTYALGDSMSLRTQVATASLEVTVRVGDHSPKQAHATPDLANVRIVPSQFDPTWVGEVDGELVNDTSKDTLSNARLSIVLLDGSGNVVGGGTGMMFSALPSGSRIVFLAQSGFTAVPLDRAVTPVISIAPSYQAPATG